MLGQVTITGTVVDGHDDEPIPFANVFWPTDPSKGVSADFDGNFTISFDQAPDSLEASAVGYSPLRLAYTGGTTVQFKLNSSAQELEEIVITGSRKEDPAYALMRKVVANKPKNNRANYPYYGCELYNKMEVDLINLSDEFMNMRLNQPFSFVFDHIDSTSEEEPFLPLFVSEALADFYYQRDPKKFKEQIKAVKIVGDAENESVGQLLGVAKAQLNVYNNWVDLVAKKFASPIADNGTSLYRYYLVDSAYIDNQKCYQVQYFPKHKGVNGFTGDFWVHDTTYAVKKIRLQLLEEGHLNFVEKLTVVQEFQQLSDGKWVPKKDFITISSTTLTEPFLPKIFKKLRQNAPGVQAKRQTTYKDFHFNEALVTQKMGEELNIQPDAFEKDTAYWAKHRHIELAKSEETAYYLIDTIKSLPIIKIWEKVTTTVVTGYMWGEYVDIGNFYEFISSNEIEGFRTKFGLRTSTGIHEDLMIGAYGAYGWKDKRWKYGTDLLYVFGRKPWRSISLAYLDDFSPTPNFNPFFSQSGNGLGSSYFLRRKNIPFKLLDVEHLSASYFHEWKSGLSAKFSLTKQSTRPLFNFGYKFNNEAPSTRYDFSEMAIELRYAYEETFIQGNYLRTSLGSVYPIVSMRYARGVKDLFGGDIAYDELQLTLRDRIRWGALGFSNLRITGGKIWGTVPYLNMYIPIGNEGVFMNYRGLNTVPEYTFAADQYVFATFDHHFDGAILQLVPLFRKMRLRSVANIRAVYGSMTTANRAANELNLVANTTEGDAVRIRVPDRTPFMEASVGVENIFRFFRVDAIWRLNYHDIPGKRFGVRASVSFNL